jgi:hypothetical protein
MIALAASCRTAPDGLPPADGAALPVDGAAALPDGTAALADLSAPPGATVSCGPGLECSIAAGEHCCDRAPLACDSAPCQDSNQFDCDGPDDCAGLLCCFPIRNGFGEAICAPNCDNGTVLCHAQGDCPAATICCLNFVLGPGVGLCLGACD